MKVILTKGLSIGWFLLAIMTIALAVVISTARVTLPMVSDYRSNIEWQVSKAMQRPVSIGEIGVGWDGLRPVLKLKNVTIRDQQDRRDSFHFRELELSFQILRSLRQLKLLPHSIYLSGSELAITRTFDGAFVVRGLSGMTPTSNITVGERLEAFKNLALNLRDVRLIWHDQPLQQNWEFKTDELQLAFWQGGLSLKGRLLLPQELGKSIDLTAVVRGDLDDYRLWAGDFYLRTDSARLSMFPTLWLDDWPRVSQGLASTETWGSWKGLDEIELTGSLSILDLKLAAAKNDNLDGDVLELPQWSGNYHWQQRGPNWHLDASDLEIVTGDRHWPGNGFSVDFQRRDGEPGYIRGDLDFIDVKTAGDLVAAVPLLPLDTRKLVRQLAPEGEVSQLTFAVATHTNTPKFLVNGNFEELHWRSAGGIPGITGFNAAVSTNEEGGIADARAPGMSFEFPRLFEKPITLDDFSADLQWGKGDNGWELAIEQIQLENSDIGGFGTAKVVIPGAGKKAEMYLELGVPELNVAKVSGYLPYGIIPPKTSKWLRHAFVGGRGHDGLVSYAGELKRNALKYEDVDFRADVSVDDVTLHYRDDWPRADQLAGDLKFRNAGFSAEVNSGRIEGAKVLGAKLGIEDFYLSRYKMDAKATGVAPQYLSFLKNSPLSKGGLREFLEQVDSEGRIDLDLTLDIPLTRKIPDPMVVDGRVGLNKNRLALPEHDVEFTQVTGELDFTVDDYRATGLEAIFLENPVQATVSTGKNREVLIDVTGEYSLHQLLPKLDAPWMKLAPGQTQVNARVTVPRNKQEKSPPFLDITSDLTGIAIQLPGELGKNVEDVRPFSMGWELGTSVPAVDLHYADRVDIRALVNMENKRFHIERADVVIGGDEARLKGQGIGIRGTMPELALEEWAVVIDRLSEESHSDPLDLREIDLQLGSLNAFGQGFPDTHFFAANFDGAWHVALDAKTIAGDLLWPETWKEGDPLEATLQRLVVARHDETSASSDETIVRPSVMPSLKADIANLTWGDAKFDFADINAVRSDQDWLIQKARFESKVMTLQGAGGWLDNAGGLPSARFQFKMEGRNMGSALKQLEFSTGLGDGQGIIQGDLSWNGSPFVPDFESLNGQLTADLREGTLKEVEPGLGRLLSLVNLDKLPKRLALNFKDVAMEGMHYDTLSGIGRFENGTLHIDGLGIDSTSAAISLYGNTYLPDRQFDLSLSVVPKFKSAVPIAAGVFIAPQTGFLVYFLDKVVEAMGVDINESALLEYKITGDWDAPNVERSASTVEETRESLFLEGE